MDRWAYLDQVIPKGLVGVPRSNNTKGNRVKEIC